ncbi:MAG: tRNA uridine-5-carboxymethylaminomethyl(34) synthesis GTPase MnmE [Fimbriimonadaceae bacterium]|nr:tRNA uridine-5-carboxymethylaminomethyl(34) synthesis GTPase MnmE [Fimbriimonadaceae bacterium]
MRRFAETIIAPFTGPGPAAVTGFRISGPDAWRIARHLAGGRPASPEPMRAYVQRLVTGEDGVILFFAAGASYTGDETAEIFAHGGPVTAKVLLETAVLAGAREALAGEFTERAFLNGRLMLSQAEAVADLIHAETTDEFALALGNHRGALQAAVAALREVWLGILARVEASTDFSEEIGEFDHAAAHAELAMARPRLDQLLEDAARSELVRRGFRIAILGRPNVGKSSLLNALLGRSRAIVTDIAGTTRDTLEESIDLRGRRAVLVDTAGLRDATDVVERIGIDRSHAAAADADLVILLFDLAAGWTDDDQRLARRYRDALIVGNKYDLAPHREVALGISAQTGAGIEALIDAISRRMDGIQPAVMVNPRHAGWLRRFSAQHDELAAALHAEVPSDLLATLLREGIVTLGQITGETASPDMLDEIFRRFCIGK